jgi:hypothetical protein
MRESKEFRGLAETVYGFAVFMALNDPVLTLDWEREYAEGEDHYCIDGFPTNRGVLVVPPVMRKNHPYQGIKPAVLFVPKHAEMPKAVEQPVLRRASSNSLYSRYQENIAKLKQYNSSRRVSKYAMPTPLSLGSMKDRENVRPETFLTSRNSISQLTARFSLPRKVSETKYARMRSGLNSRRDSSSSSSRKNRTFISS